jgi:hypothetical protein
MPPAGCGVGHPITCKFDIILIAGLSMAAVLTGRLAGFASVRVADWADRAVLAALIRHLLGWAARAVCAAHGISGVAGTCHC